MKLTVVLVLSSCLAIAGCNTTPPTRDPKDILRHDIDILTNSPLLVMTAGADTYYSSEDGNHQYEASTSSLATVSRNATYIHNGLHLTDTGLSNVIYRENGGVDCLSLPAALGKFYSQDMHNTAAVVDNFNAGKSGTTEFDLSTPGDCSGVQSLLASLERDMAKIPDNAGSLETPEWTDSATLADGSSFSYFIDAAPCNLKAMTCSRPHGAPILSFRAFSRNDSRWVSIATGPPPLKVIVQKTVGADACPQFFPLAGHNDPACGGSGGSGGGDGAGYGAGAPPADLPGGNYCGDYGCGEVINVTAPKGSPAAPPVCSNNCSAPGSSDAGNSTGKPPIVIRVPPMTITATPPKPQQSNCLTEDCKRKMDLYCNDAGVVAGVGLGATVTGLAGWAFGCLAATPACVVAGITIAFLGGTIGGVTQNHTVAACKESIGI